MESNSGSSGGSSIGGGSSRGTSPASEAAAAASVSGANAADAGTAGSAAAVGAGVKTFGAEGSATRLPADQRVAGEPDRVSTPAERAGLAQEYKNRTGRDLPAPGEPYVPEQ